MVAEGRRLPRQWVLFPALRLPRCSGPTLFETSLGGSGKRTSSGNRLPTVDSSELSSALSEATEAQRGEPSCPGRPARSLSRWDAGLTPQPCANREQLILSPPLGLARAPGLQASALVSARRKGLWAFSL